MLNFPKLFNGQHAYIDEDGFLSFNPKYEKVVGTVHKTGMTVDCPSLDVSTFNQPNQYVSGPETWIISYEIYVDYDITNMEVPMKSEPKPEIEQKEINKTQEEFMFIDLKD